ncbi:MAG: hypothetical protein HY957_05850 [Nitrospirae bacterium]|nr:hypothetical protein [Nitrospirota bacterium]
MRNYIFSIIILAAVMTFWGCTSTFFIAKDGSRSCTFGDNRAELYRVLCGGDLKEILADTKLPQEIKDEIYKYNCSPTGRSSEMVKQAYSALTEEQRGELKQAFRKHGYKINPPR